MKMKKQLLGFLGSILLAASPLFGADLVCQTPAGVREGLPFAAANTISELRTNGAAHVAVKFCGGVAGYTTDGYIFEPGVETYLGTVNGGSQGTIDIGAYSQGTQIVFKIYVRNTNQTYLSTNPNFARIVALGGNKFWIGFNDNLPGAGDDQDFNDIQFVVQVDTVNEICPCDNNWANHGDYVSCIAHAANSFVNLGVLKPNEKGPIISVAGQSRCGK